MTQPSARELERLSIVAGELYDAVDGEAFTIDAALAQNRAFTAGRGPSSSLERSILKPAVHRGASRAGLGVDHIGAGIELVSDDTSGHPVRRRYRLLRVQRGQDDGRLHGVCNRDSTLLRTEPDELWNVERWVLGYRFSEDHTLAELVVAQIIDFEDTGAGPLTIVFGNPYSLTPTPVLGGFVSTDDALFADDEMGAVPGESVAP